MSDKVTLGKLSTGVPGLDTLLGGGLTEFSFNLIAGAPGSGKTTLAHQIMFALTQSGRKAIFFTVLGEPPIKMLRYQQQYAFFDVSQVGKNIQYINLAEDLRMGDFSGVLERISREVEAFSPDLVFVDSFRSVVQTARTGTEGVADLQYFVQELGTRMASWQATTFLIGEYAHPEAEANPILTVADGLISLSQNVAVNSVTRKIRVVKMRGQHHMAGYHIFRISDRGVHVYPRLLPPLAGERTHGDPVETNVPRVPTGVAGIDRMMEGGLPAGHSLLVVGPTGVGKTILSTAFLKNGVDHGEKGVIASFEKGTSRLRNAALEQMVQAGNVAVLENRSLDLSVEEVLESLLDTIARTGATRVVIDSLSEFSLYLAPEFRQDFRESVFRILTALAKTGVTVMLTLGMEDRFTEMRFSRSDLSFLTDAVMAMRYVAVEGKLTKVLAIVKVRGSNHSRELRQFEITDQGIEVGESMVAYEGVLSAHPSAAGTDIRHDF
ncbi:ATPase domain-containing protein [Noviherbaspirillum sp. Root189]|uniref:ATPase domain-containing protein n=1 Tax=Noviherbaspirillum sp. Root189 TaxID=1736487 RepID=UPI00070D2EA0|nr:ATPase domain-containing protein [Noviherbaspirillum sp. Root189]KRB93073.1 protein kinase [Noviherbaspirillum sp. Root189]